MSETNRFELFFFNLKNWILDFCQFKNVNVFKTMMHSKIVKKKCQFMSFALVNWER